MFNKQVLLLSVWILLTVFVISCQANEEEESAKENTKRNEHEAAFKNDEAMKVASETFQRNQRTSPTAGSYNEPFKMI